MSRWERISSTDTSLLEDIFDPKGSTDQATGHIWVDEGPFGETRIGMSLQNGPQGHPTHAAHCALSINLDQLRQLIAVLNEAERLAVESSE